MPIPELSNNIFGVLLGLSEKITISGGVNLRRGKSPHPKVRAFAFDYLNSDTITPKMVLSDL
jgi:hypothetical protein